MLRSSHGALGAVQPPPGAMRGAETSRTAGYIPERGSYRLRLAVYAVFLAAMVVLPQPAGVASAQTGFEIQPQPSPTIQPGQSAVVTGTEGRGLRVRSGPAMSHSIVTTAN